MTPTPRVAFFTDSYLEVNGLALTSRQFESYARRTNRPFLSVYATDASVPHIPNVVVPLRRGHASFRVERDLSFDLNLWRYRKAVVQAVKSFGADIVHVTSPGDVGFLGAWVAHVLNIPMAASWHTNLHEYVKLRLRRSLSSFPDSWQNGAGELAEVRALQCILRFYQLARITFAPNVELVRMLESGTGRPSFLMQRGVQTDLFSPARRTVKDGVFRIGFVGRLSAEKNVRLFAHIERALLVRGIENFRIMIVGEGGERRWLEENLKNADFTGVLRNEKLAEAYANMDLFVFPSDTDTFGNVVLEAQASGVPALVSAGGGPKYLVEEGASGFVVRNESEFVDRIVHLMSSPEKHSLMREQARRSAMQVSWDRVFENVYQTYEIAIGRCNKEVA